VEHDHERQSCTIRVLVADNSRFHTQLLVGVLSRDPDLQVVSSDLNAASLVAASITENIDVFVLSAFVNEGAQRGVEILQELRETNPNARAVMLLDSSKPEAVLEAFRAGARGVFDHQESSDMLCQCIRKVHQGQVWVNDDQMAVVLDALASAPKVRAVGGNGMNLLSKREADVVACLAEGLTNREIGERLGLSQHTIKNHMFRIFDKLGVSNRIELMFMTLSQSTAAPPLLEALLKDPAGDYDEASLAFCEKAAEHGVLAAQLLLARIALTGRASDSDVIRSYMWYCVAVDQLNGAMNNVKKAMNSAQIAEGDRKIRERLNKSHRIVSPLSPQASSSYKSSIVA
jgi:two-component system nitrate/nitrite response regulator NarL